MSVIRVATRRTNYCSYEKPVARRGPSRHVARGATSKMTNREKVLLVGGDPRLLPWYLEWKLKNKRRMLRGE